MMKMFFRGIAIFLVGSLCVGAGFFGAGSLQVNAQTKTSGATLTKDSSLSKASSSKKSGTTTKKILKKPVKKTLKKKTKKSKKKKGPGTSKLLSAPLIDPNNPPGGR